MRSLIFNVWFYAASFVLAMIFAVACYVASGDTIRRMIAWWGRRVQSWVRLILGSTVEVRGRENIPSGGAFIVAPKHQSELDVATIFNLFPDCGAVVMAELANYPFLGALIRKLDLIAVSVSGGPQGKTDMIKSGARRVAAEGRPILIYPEGELMKLGARERYKSGVFHIYEATGAPVLPVAQSLGVIWPQRQWRKRAGVTGAVHLLPPIPPGLDKEAFMARLEETLESETMKLIREHAPAHILADAEDRYARRASNRD